MLDLTKVHSSNVLAIGFENNILEVWFVDGAIYHYFGVPEHIYNSFYPHHQKVNLCMLI